MHGTTEDRLLLLETKPPRILSLSLEGQDVVEFVANCGGTPDGIAIDYLNRHVYWTNMGDDWSANDGFIERIDFDGENRVIVIPKGATYTPKQIQIHTDSQLLYWCDREGMRVMRSRTDGSDITVLVETGSTAEDRRDERLHCVGIAIDRSAQRLFWTQKGPPNAGLGRIFSAPLEIASGESPANRTDVRLEFDALPEPIDLEWDSENCTLYWTDRGDPPRANTLNRCKFVNGRPQPPEILSSNLQEGIGLALDEKRGLAYVSDLGGLVHAVALRPNTTPRLLISGRGSLTGIALWRSTAA